jgi:hypothetical protein
MSVTGWDIEFQLSVVHQHIRPKQPQGRFHGIARTMHDQFSDSQKTMIYGLLLDLIDDIPWPGIDWESLWRTVARTPDDSGPTVAIGACHAGK